MTQQHKAVIFTNGWALPGFECVHKQKKLLAQRTIWLNICNTRQFFLQAKYTQNSYRNLTVFY